MAKQKSQRELKHREQKRIIEIKSIIQELKEHLADKDGLERGEPLQILEFGSGEGFQVPFLKELGNVTASDVYTNPIIKDMDVSFVECGIGNTPFADNTFDIIFSNHVLEHIPDLQAAFKEMKRIGKPGCVYAFSVATSIWLLLAVPVQYAGKFLRIFRKNNRNSQDSKIEDSHVLSEHSSQKKKSLWKKIWNYITPNGHGYNRSFLKCYKNFRINNWQRLFSNHSFEVVNTIPLLLYAPSEMPYIPTTKRFVKYGICSSVFFILSEKKE